MQTNIQTKLLGSLKKQLKACNDYQRLWLTCACKLQAQVRTNSARLACC